MQDFRLSLWELKVPAISKYHVGLIDVGFHKMWEERARKISSGPIIMHATSGHGVERLRKLFAERVIPVRISCTRVEIRHIMKMTREHYELKEVFAHLVSEVVLIEKGDD